VSQEVNLFLFTLAIIPLPFLLLFSGFKVWDWVQSSEKGQTGFIIILIVLVLLFFLWAFEWNPLALLLAIIFGGGSYAPPID